MRYNNPIYASVADIPENPGISVIPIVIFYNITLQLIPKCNNAYSAFFGSGSEKLLSGCS
jgi:hypothetical protein